MTKAIQRRHLIGSGLHFQRSVHYHHGGTYGRHGAGGAKSSTCWCEGNRRRLSPMGSQEKALDLSDQTWAYIWDLKVLPPQWPTSSNKATTPPPIKPHLLLAPFLIGPSIFKLPQTVWELTSCIESSSAWPHLKKSIPWSTWRLSKY